MPVLVCCSPSCVCFEDVGDLLKRLMQNRLSGFIQCGLAVIVLIVIFSVTRRRNECQHGAKDPREQPLMFSVVGIHIEHCVTQ